MISSAIALALVQAAPAPPAQDRSFLTVTLREFALTQSKCVVLASGRIVPGISAEQDGPYQPYEADDSAPDIRAVLPGEYRDAKIYRFNRAMLGGGSSETSPVRVAWQETKRLCAIVARLPTEAAAAAQEARKIVERYEFKFEGDGIARSSIPANPALMAPSSNLVFVPDSNPQDDLVVTRVEHRED